MVVTHQLQIERRTGKVRRPEIDVLPLCHATIDGRMKGQFGATDLFIIAVEFKAISPIKCIASANNDHVKVPSTFFTKHARNTYCGAAWSLARDVIYTSRAYAMMPVRLSVCL